MAAIMLRTLAVVLAVLAAACTVSAQDGSASAEEETPPLAVETPKFDPGRMPPVEADPPALGWRFGGLTSRQTSVLRRGFKLPLDALTAADSPQDLMRSAVVAPLPDPSRPMLAVGAAAVVGADPFASGAIKRTSFRDDPMRALGEWLGVTDEETGTAFSSTTDPFASDSGDGFDVETPAADTPAVDESDPFADDGDDPFADF